MSQSDNRSPLSCLSHQGTVQRTRPVSCGTLVVNPHGQLLLCHVTNTDHWDIPKGIRDQGETSLAAAMREMQEEAGLTFPAELFEDLGEFDYRLDKRLHLFRVRSPARFESLATLVCTSFFPHHKTGEATPEVDGFRWADRSDIATLCWPRMAKRLMALDWLG